MGFLVLFAVFGLAAVVLGLAALTGRRGDVCTRGVGYAVPAAVESDPALNHAANELVTRWCTIAALMAAAPLLPLGQAIATQREPLPLPGLLVLAGYAFVVAVLGGYPFERINHLADAPR